MTIKAGDKIPSIKLKYASAEGPKETSTDEIFKGKRVVLFGLPGAFTPTCSAKHLPGFIQHSADLKKKGVDTVACISVNDAFVMGAWAQNLNVGDKVMMLADGSADFTRAVGLTLDLKAAGLGERSQRYAMVVDDGVVKKVDVEQSAGACEVSSADAILAGL